MATETKWSRLRDLPEYERAPFEKWLEGQTRPIDDRLPDSEQDFYYLYDYERWMEVRRGGVFVWN